MHALSQTDKGNVGESSVRKQVASCKKIRLTGPSSFSNASNEIRRIPCTICNFLSSSQLKALFNKADSVPLD